MSENRIIKIALCGKANAGKNTAAKLIMNSLGFSEEESEIIAFADPIKEMIMIMFPWADRECLYGSSKLRAEAIPNAYDKNGNNITYRQALIDLGTQGRIYNDRHWINVFEKKISELKKSPGSIKLIICTDIRFVNEFDYLRSNHFYILKIRRDSGIVLHHSTETNQDAIKEEYFDAVVHNNGAMQDLQISINNILTSIKEKK